MQHFTIIIPSRNRADTLQWAVRSCLAQDYENMTLLVSNNCSADNTEEMLATFNDPRLKVIKTPAPTSMTGNVEYALNHVLEEDTYVTCIGDDDGLLPGGLAHANSLLEKYGKVGAVTWKTSNYNWPNCLVPEWQNALLLSRSDHSQLVDAKEMLVKAAEYSVYYFDLPGLWTSFVATSELRKWKERLGTMMISMHPDTGSAVMLACSLDKYVYTYRGVTFFGSSGHSNGLSFALQKQNKMEMFLSANTIKPHHEIVLAPNGVYYVTESLLQARDLGILPPEVKIDMARAVRLMALRNPSDRPGVYERICAAAEATAALHNIPFDLAELTRINEEQNEAAKLIRDPIVTEHERWYSHRCDPSLTNNVYTATILAGEILAMLRNYEIVTHSDHVEEMAGKDRQISAAAQALVSSQQTVQELSARLPEHEATRAELELTKERLAKLEAKQTSLAEKLERTKERSTKLQKKLEATKTRRRRGLLERIKRRFGTVKDGE